MDRHIYRRKGFNRVARGVVLPAVPLMAILFAVGIPLGAVDGPVWVIIVALVIGGAVYLYGAYRRLFVERVEWDDETLEIHNAWSSRSLAWSEVQEVKLGKPWWLAMDEGKSDLYVPVVFTAAGEEIALAVMYTEGADPETEPSARAKRMFGDKTEIRALLDRARR